MTKASNEYPGWPAGEQGTLLSDIDVDKSMEELFALMHGGTTEFREKVNAATKIQNYASTGWLPSADDALHAPPSDKIVKSLSEIKPEMALKNTFLQPAMGNMVQTTDLQRVLEVNPAKNVILQSTVCTGATYGDKFRAVSKRFFEPISPTRTRVRTIGTVVFVGSVSGFIKNIIKSKSLDGMKDAFSIIERVLAEYATVRPYQAEAPVRTVTPPAPIAVAGEASAVKSALEQIVGATVVDALEPWAAFVHAALAHMPYLGGVTTDIVLSITVAVFGVSVLRVCLDVLRFAESAGRDPKDFLSYLSYHIFRVIHLPSSYFEVLTTLGIALLARAVMIRLASLLPPPPSGSRPSSAAGAAASALGASITSGSGGAVTEDSEGQSGVKYDGYRQAMATSAQNNYFGGKGPKSVLNKYDKQSEEALTKIREGLVKVGNIAKSGRKKIRQHHHHHHNHLHHHLRPGSREGRNGAAAAEPSAPGTKSPMSTEYAISGEYDEESSTSIEDSQSASTSPVASPPTSPPMRGLNYSTKRRPDGSKPHPELDADADQEALEAAGSHLLSPEGYSGLPPDLPKSLKNQAVVESIFENERLQPFRGWGHTWPGHFLPTDQVMHWSYMDKHTGLDIAYSQDLTLVVPPLPQGWRWLEPEWHLDLAGVFSDSTDNEGWSYGLDFPWLKYPFVPGNGRKKMADFVRRRRWLRTRVPIEEPAEPAAAAGASPPQEETEANGYSGPSSSSSSSNSSSAASATKQEGSNSNDGGVGRDITAKTLISEALQQDLLNQPVENTDEGLEKPSASAPEPSAAVSSSFTEGAGKTTEQSAVSI